MRIAGAAFLVAAWATPASSSCVDALPCKDDAGTVFVYGSPYNPALESSQNVIELETPRKRLIYNLAACEKIEGDSCSCKLDAASRHISREGPLFVNVGDEESGKTFFFAHDGVEGIAAAFEPIDQSFFFGHDTPGQYSAQFIRIDNCPASTLLAFQEKQAFLARERLALPGLTWPVTEVFHFGRITRF
jgi:hypothetical protein